MRDRILDQTYILFAEKGTQFSMVELANMLNLKAPSIYNYFGSKSEIIDELIKREIDVFSVYLNKAYDGLSAETSDVQLKKTFYALVQYFFDIERSKCWRRFGLLDESQRTVVKKKFLKSDSAIAKTIHNIFSACITDNFISNKKIEDLLMTFYIAFFGLLHSRVYHEGDDCFMQYILDVTWENLWLGYTSSGRETPG